ncbi:MAG: cyclase, partial [Mycobacterium sp.]|nr:cyclase [Mycobacterium sp.]
ATVKKNAALIAEHLEAAGDGLGAYGWHMRAAGWATNRDITAARLSWERAQGIADVLPSDDPDRPAMRIAPRTMLCGNGFRFHVNVAGDRFDELRELCTAAGDKASLAIGMAGLVVDHAFHDRMSEASELASEAMSLVESLGDLTLRVGLSPSLIYSTLESAQWSDMARWSQQVIDLADGDPSKGNFILGSPLAVAIVSRGIAGYHLGWAGWREDVRHGVDLARRVDSMSHAVVVAWAYNLGIPCGVLAADDSSVGVIKDALRSAERSGDDLATAVARMTLGTALVHRHSDADRDRGRKLLAEVGDVFRRRGHNLGELPLVDAYTAREQARRGDLDDAIPLMRATTDHLFRERGLLEWSIPLTGVLVETLLDRGTDADVAEAEAAIERLAAAPADGGLVLRDVWLLRLRALLARAHGDATAYAQLGDRYGDMAKALGFEGHIVWAEAMP